MKHRKKKKQKAKDSYEAPLFKIFLWSGLDVFVALLMVCAVIGVLIFVYRRQDFDGIKLMCFCLALTVLCAYGLSLLSLLRVWRQEHILGIYWKNRTDGGRPMEERDWYLAYNRGGFLLYHRAYIQRILDASVVEQTTDLGRETVHCLRFEDISGKKHTLKFSSSREQKRFQQWYKHSAWISESSEIQ